MITVVTQFDSEYFDWAKLCCMSLQKTNPMANFFGYAVNLTQEQLKEANRIGMKLVCEKIDFQGMNPNIKKALMANRRAKISVTALKDLRPAGDEIIVLTDADILFRKSLDPLEKLMSDCDAGCVFRDGRWNGKTYDHLKIACGFVAYKNTAQKLMEDWDHMVEHGYEPIFGKMPGEWFWDQVTLLKAVMTNNLKYATLDHDVYINRDFGGNAIAWSAHRPPKEVMYEKFMKEYEEIE